MKFFSFFWNNEKIIIIIKVAKQSPDFANFFFLLSFFTFESCLPGKAREREGSYVIKFLEIFFSVFKLSIQIFDDDALGIHVFVLFIYPINRVVFFCFGWFVWFGLVRAINQAKSQWIFSISLSLENSFYSFFSAD